MDLLGATESRVRCSLEIYKRVLSALERAAKVLAGEDSRAFRDHLRKVRLQLDSQANPQIIQQSGEQVENELDGFARGLADTRDRREREYKLIIRIVAEAGITIAKGGSSQSEELAQFATKIDSVSRLGSVTEIRNQLAVRVAELKVMARRIQEEGKARASALEGEIRSVQERLRVAETLAETDALTGLGNRRMAEKTMQAAILSATPFSLLVFDLNGFKSVNDRYGHTQGDHLLKAIGQKLKTSVRESDVVCRWGGDEFFVLLADSSLAVAEERAIKIQAHAFGQFLLSDAGRDIPVHVNGSVGVAEYRPGETASEFFVRADQILYEKKEKRATVAQLAPT